MDGESYNQHDLWGQFRFAVIGGLLTHPLEQGGLQEELHKLSELTYRHPLTGPRWSSVFPPLSDGIIKPCVPRDQLQR